MQATDLLAAIYAEPFAPGPRAVYGDWLQAAGDPQGELIALQLARAAGRPGDEARERALIAKHRDAWAGPLAKWFRSHVFEGGLFAGGVVKPIPAAQLARVLREPAWAAVRLVARDPGAGRGAGVEELIERPELAHVRAVYDLWSRDAAALASGPRRPWTELGVWSTVSPGERDALGACAALPELTTFGLWIDAADVPWIAAAPLFRRLRTLVVLENSGFAELHAALVAMPGVRELVLATHRGPLFAPNAWTLRFVRDRAPGPFTRITGRYTPGPGTHPGYHLDRLRIVPTAPLTSIVLEAGRCKLDAEETAFARDLLARFAQVPERTLPFDL